MAAITLDPPVFLTLLVLTVTWRLYATFRRKSAVESLPAPVSRSHNPPSTDTSANSAAACRLAQNFCGAMSGRSS